MARNLPVAFGLILCGGILIDKGAQAFSGGLSAARSGTAGKGASSVLPGVTGSVGQVAPSDLSHLNTYGWSSGQLADWMAVISKESSGDPAARNPSSGAFGIGQFLGSTLLEYASKGATSLQKLPQLTAMREYIHDRYGDPSAALAHENQFGWY